MTTIEKLETLPGMLPDDKASILFVHARLQPTALAVMQSEPFPTNSEVQHIPKEWIDMLHEVLHELALEHTMTFEIMFTHSIDEQSYSQEVLRIFVAPDKATAKQLELLFSNIQQNHVAAGMLLGYPKTAVEAFLTPDMLDWETMPSETETVSRADMQLLGHRLSKAHWQNEIQYLAAWGTCLRKTSPRLYEAITTQV